MLFNGLAYIGIIAIDFLMWAIVIRLMLSLV